MKEKLNKAEKIETQIKNSELVQKRHQQIAMGATQLFIKKGYFKTGIREISKVTGIKIGNLYDYIKKKEDILYLVCDVFQSMWFNKLEKEEIFRMEDPVNQLKVALRTMFELVHEHKDMVLLVYTETKLLPKNFLVKILEKEGGLIKYFEEILKKGVEKGQFKIKDPFLLANIIVYLVSIEPLRGWNFRKHYSYEEFSKFMTELILDMVYPK